MAYKLIIPPDQNGYGFTNGSEVLRTKLDGGLGRYRVDILNASRQLSCQWTVGPNDYQYLQSFYSVVKGAGFLVDLYMDAGVLTEHTAHFMPDSFGLVSQSGLTFVVGAQLEVEPIDNSEYDQSLIDLIDIYGSSDAAIEVLNLLEKLVNVDLPEIT